MSAPAARKPRVQPPTVSGPAAMMAGPPMAKPLNFKSSVRRLLRMLRPDKTLLWAALALGVTGVTLR